MEGESAQNDLAGIEVPAMAPERGGSVSERELRVHVPAELRDISFPHAVRGYERVAVDAYVKRVNHVIAELEVSRSPRAAVRHALDRATEEVSGILQRAQETAEEITASARKEAEEGAARTGAQAAKLLVDANDTADRARAEADEVLAKAKAEAETSLATARAEAEEILTRARTEGGERLQRSEGTCRPTGTRRRPGCAISRRAPSGRSVASSSTRSARWRPGSRTLQARRPLGSHVRSLASSQTK